MASIYEETLNQAVNIVKKAPDRSLASLQFKESIFNTVKISIPKLYLEQTNVEIKDEKISFNNAPPGISFSPSGNTIIESVTYRIPIGGDIKIFTNLARLYIDRRTSYIEHNNLYYKVYSERITGNDELIEEIKKRVTAFTATINDSLKKIEDEVIEFHESKLKPAIEEFIKIELARRNLKSDSETKLNPFA